MPFALTWYPSHERPPRAIDAEHALERDRRATGASWAARCALRPAKWSEDVQRSLAHPQGAHLRADRRDRGRGDDSLPEKIGGVRNWDYRYCWLRDATLTLLALLNAGYTEEARAWRDWLLRAAAGDPVGAPDHVRRRRRAAADRGRVSTGCPATRARSRCASATRPPDSSSSTCTARCSTRSTRAASHELEASTGRRGRSQRRLLDYLEDVVAGARRRHLGGARPAPALHPLEGDGLGRVRPRASRPSSASAATARSTAGARSATRSTREVCEQGFDAERNAFVQSYGSKRLDASLLMIPLVGFLPADDPRMRRHRRRDRARAHARRLRLPLRHDEDTQTSTACRRARARSSRARSGSPTTSRCRAGSTRREEIFERLLALRNDVGLLAEEYDPVARRQLGNFPQAFTHVALVNTAFNLSQQDERSPMEQRTPHEKPAAYPD